MGTYHLSKRWQRLRRTWLAAHPGPHDCYLCGQPIEGSVSLDHIIPISDLLIAGQPNITELEELALLAPSHRACNSRKGTTHHSLVRKNYKADWLYQQPNE